MKGKEFYLQPEDAISRIQNYHYELTREDGAVHQHQDEERQEIDELTKEALTFYLAEKKKKAKAKTNVTRKAKEKPAAPAPVK